MASACFVLTSTFGGTDKPHHYDAHVSRRHTRPHAARCWLSPDVLELVRALRAREHREKTGQYTVEGVRFLVTAADSGAEITALIVCEALLSSVVGQMIVRRLRRRSVPVHAIDEAHFASLSRLVDGSGRGVIAVVRQRWRALERLADDDLWLAVETVRSPGNLGTLLRTCLAVGARGVIVIGDADVHDPACVRATMGALDALALVRLQPSELVALVRRSHATLVGASPDGRLDFRRTSYTRATVVLLGSERRGISREMRRACDSLVRIPMASSMDSLNLAVAGSLVLYEAFAQRSPAR